MSSVNDVAVIALDACACEVVGVSRAVVNFGVAETVAELLSGDARLAFVHIVFAVLFTVGNCLVTLFFLDCHAAGTPRALPRIVLRGAPLRLLHALRVLCVPEPAGLAALAHVRLAHGVAHRGTVRYCLGVYDSRADTHREATHRYVAALTHIGGHVVVLLAVGDSSVAHVVSQRLPTVAGLT